jgi:hypothetical protein
MDWWILVNLTIKKLNVCQSWIVVLHIYNTFSLNEFIAIVPPLKIIIP